MKTSVLKPGYLVSLKTSLRGGVSYHRVDVDPEHKDESGALVAKWETSREIPDPAEFERAQLTRSAARTMVAKVCSASSFGLLCPTSREGELFDCVEAARALVAEHNRNSVRSQVGVYVLVGRIASDDAEAARAIGAEVRELLEAMRQGIANADPDAIREAANKARGLGQMLDPQVAGSVSAAIVEAREAARAIVRRVQKAGETAAQVVAECTTARLDAARIAFLDFDPAQAVGEADAPARGGIDLTPCETLNEITMPGAQSATVTAIELPDGSEINPARAAGPRSAATLELF